MKALSFEIKKLLRTTGFKYICVLLVAFNFFYCIIAPLETPSATEKEDHIGNYRSDIEYVVRTAKRNKTDYEAFGKDSYLVRYQQDIIDRYSYLAKSDIRPEGVTGWDEFFADRADVLLLILIVITAGIIVSMTEIDNETDQLLFMTAKGRKSVASKALVLAVFSASAAVMLDVSSMTGIAVRFGLSSPFVPIQSVIRYTYCPYGISIASLLLFRCLIRTAALYAASVFAAWTASLFRSYAASYFASFAPFAVGFALPSGSEDTVKTILPYNAVSSATFFERYRSFDLFGISVPVITFAAAVYFCVCVLVTFAFCVTFFSAVQNDFFKRIEKSAAFFITGIKNKILSSLPEKKFHRHGLLFSEAKKLFIKSHAAVICILMITVKICSAAFLLAPTDQYESSYRDVCFFLSGELTDEKRVYIADQLFQSGETLSHLNDVRNSYQAGSMTREEYDAFMRDYDAAEIKRQVFERMERKCSMIDEARSKGVAAEIVYDTGWNEIFSSGSDLLLLVLLLLVFCGIYSPEYRHGFDMYAQTTSRGMRSVDRAKLLLTVITVFAVFLIFAFIDLSAASVHYGLPDARKPLASVISAALHMSILTGAILKETALLIFALLFGIFVCLLSKYLKKSYAVLPIGAIPVIVLYLFGGAAI